MDADRFGHQVSRYERPNFPYRCGRAAIWGRPCARGPLNDGKCGGVSECEPYFNGQGYECRRSPAAGGPCRQGPLPDGRCSIQRPACAPRRTLRSQRRRATYLAALISLVALIGFAGAQNPLSTIVADLMAPAVSSEGDRAADGAGDGGGPPVVRHARFSLLNPGALTGAHARFTEERGCASCHGDVGAGPAQWLTGVLTAHDMSEACSQCHLFSGPPDSPHNLALADAGGAEPLRCSFCHSEHKGAEADIAAMPDARCHSCHEAALQFSSFSRDHPAFGANYPYRGPTAIKYDHNRHRGIHFLDARYQERAPAGCHSCHDMDRAGLKVPIGSYEAMCVDCHGEQIGSQALTLVTWPYGETDPLTFPELDPDSEAPPAEEVGVSAEDLIAACGSDSDALAALQERLDAAAEPPAEPPAEPDAEPGVETAEDGEEEEEEEEFFGESEEDPGAMDAFLLDIDPTDDVEYWAPYRSLMLRMAVQGKAPLEELLDARLGEGAGKLHLASLDQGFVKAFGCAWAANEEFEPEDDDEAEEGAAGAAAWSSNGFNLEYRAAHGDPVLRDWLTRLMGADPALEALDEELREEIRAIFLPETGDGVGSCTSCHWLDGSAFEGGGEAPASGLVWKDRPSDRGPVLYDHVPHINLLGRGTWCLNCHQLDKEAPYGANFKAEAGASYVSNFKPIDVGTCADCHRAEEGVRQDCLTCHEYHHDPSIRERMQSHEAKSQPDN